MTNMTCYVGPCKGWFFKFKSQIPYFIKQIENNYIMILLSMLIYLNEEI